MDTSNRPTVVDKDGRRGTIETEAPLSSGDSDEHVLVRLDTGERVSVPVNVLEQAGENSYRLPVSLTDQTDEREQVTIPVVEESVKVGKRMVETGRVRVRKQIHEYDEKVDETLVGERVDIERVPINREIERPISVRQEGDTTIVPVLEEVLVVQKRLILREEIHITKRPTERQETHNVTLRSEEVVVERDKVDRTDTRTDEETIR